MKTIQQALQERVQPTKSPPNGEFNASVNEILAVVGETPKYGRGYWSRLLKKSGKSYVDILALVKQAKDKEKKGGFLTNKLLGK